MSPADDLKFMRLAIEEAKKSKREDERTHPLVGCVVVSQTGEILVSAHRGELEPGEHAEFTALEKKLLDSSLVDATVYTTLEPCTARHPPKLACAFRILERKVARVVVGMLDPNPNICGRGIWLLRDQRVATDFFPDSLMSEIEELNREFIRSHRPPARLLPPTEATTEQPSSEPDSKTDALTVSNQAAAELSEDELFSAMFNAVWDRRFDEGNAKFEELMQRVDDPGRKKRGRAIYLHLLYERQGDESSLEELKQLAEDEDTRHLALGYLGTIALLGKDYDEAISKFKAAIGVTQNDELAAGHMIDLAETYRTVGQLDDARSTLVAALRRNLPAPLRARLLVALARVYGDKDEPLMRAGLLARAAQLLPADPSKRFDAAYSMAQKPGLKELSLSHYSSLLGLRRDHPSALNNFGVGCENLGLNGRAVEAYAEATELGDTLAAANLGGMYTRAGFYKQAEEMLAQASKKENAHDNVSAAKTTLAQNRASEEERWKDLMSMAVKQQRFLTGFADALLATSSPSWCSRRWLTHDRSHTTAAKKAGTLVFEWDNNSGAGGRRLTLVLEGDAASGTIAKLGTHGLVMDTVRCAAYMSSDQNEIRFMLLDGNDPSFVSWTSGAPALATVPMPQLPPAQ